MISFGRLSFSSLVTFGFVLVAALWGGYLGWRQIDGSGSVLDSIEYLTVDWRYAMVGPRPAPRGVVLAAIDDVTIEKVGAYPLPRNVVARIIRGLAALDPKAIAIDIAFLDPRDPETDKELADALHSTRSVIAAIGVFEKNAEQHEDQPADDLALAPDLASVLWPAPPFLAAARPGLVNLAADASGVPRFIPMIYRSGEGVDPSFALAAASAALKADPVLVGDDIEIAGRTVKMDLGYHLPIRYYGPQGAIREFSASRVLSKDLDPDLVRDQIVVLGATALGISDKFGTPFDENVPGAEVFATGITNLLAGDGLVRTAFVRKVDAATAILFPCLTVTLMAMRRIYLGLAIVGLVTAFWAAFTVVAFAQGYWLSVAVPLTALVPVTAAYGAARLSLDRIVSTRLAADKASLSSFQSPLLVEHILRNPGFLDEPVQQQVAVIFVDLGGYTGLAELLGPRKARDLLAAFQSMVEREVMSRDGFVASFMGDGAMIVFGLPKPRADDASRALLTVVGLYESTVKWLEALPPVTKERLDVRVGGHYGAAVVSRLGSARHQHIAATGDTVNVASRLLEVAKQQHCNVVVSEDLVLVANLPDSAREAIAGTEIEVAIRGRVQPMRIRMMTSFSRS
jgi:adenylate cyclase